MPDKTAELYRDGWLHTGDKARVDDDGFVYLTGRVKDYFKTIQGKFVAPVPIESDFADNPHTAQVCLLGRGYSKTVMVCVLNESGQRSDRAEVERTLRAKAEAINASVEKHARLGALILCSEAWTIENEVLTPTLKIRRERVEARFGERAEPLARASAEQSTLLIEWSLARKLVEAAGIEPASAWRPASASTCVASARFRWGLSQKRGEAPT